METRANFALIGAFTLAVLASAFLFVFWFSSFEKVGGRKTYRIVFTGSVSGLSRGAKVLFNGLPVGEVTSLGLMDEEPVNPANTARSEAPIRVSALVDIDARTPIKNDTQAQLEFTGLTGIASIAFTGGGVSSPALDSHPADGIPIIPGDKSDIQNLLATLQSISKKADDILAKTDALLADGDGSIKSTIRNIQIFSKALADNAGGVGDFLATAGDIGRTLKPLSVRLESLAANLDNVVKAVDPVKVASIVTRVDTLVGDNADSIGETFRNAKAFTKTLADSSEAIAAAIDPNAIKSIVGNADDFSRKLVATTDKFNGLTERASAVVAAIDPAQVTSLVADSASLTKKLNGTADLANGIAAAIDPAQVGIIVGQTAELTKKLGATSDKIGSFADSANDLMAAVDQTKIRDIVSNAAETSQKLNNSADRIRAVASAVDADQVKGIVSDTASIAKQLNATSGKLDGLIASAQNLLGSPESRGTLTDIGDAAKSIKRLADNLDARTRDISAGIVRFTGQGLRQYEALATDGRKTLDEINRTVRSFSKNPSQVIFGGKPAIPEYSAQ